MRVFICVLSLLAGCPTTGADDSDDTDVVGSDTDCATLTTWYADDDGDGYGNEDVSTQACAVPTGFVAVAGDCDDAAVEVNPSADEVCGDNPIDEDCDGLTDDDDDSLTDASLWYRDRDGDGFGGEDETPMSACESTSAYVDNADDCDDYDSEVNPNAVEVCDAWATDEDCSGFADDDDPFTDAATFTTWYRDHDGEVDFLLGSPNSDASATDAGVCWLVYGPVSGTIDLATAADARFLGTNGSDYLCIAGAIIGDNNDDGRDDIALGASGGDQSGYIDYGAVWVFFGE